MVSSSVLDRCPCSRVSHGTSFMLLRYTELTPYALRELVKVAHVETPDTPGGKRKVKIHISYDFIGPIAVEILSKAEQA